MNQKIFPTLPRVSWPVDRKGFLIPELSEFSWAEISKYKKIIFYAGDASPSRIIFILAIARLWKSRYPHFSFSWQGDSSHWPLVQRSGLFSEFLKPEGGIGLLVSSWLVKTNEETLTFYPMYNVERKVSWNAMNSENDTRPIVQQIFEKHLMGKNVKFEPAPLKEGIPSNGLQRFLTDKRLNLSELDVLIFLNQMNLSPEQKLSLPRELLYKYRDEIVLVIADFWPNYSLPKTVFWISTSEYLLNDFDELILIEKSKRLFSNNANHLFHGMIYSNCSLKYQAQRFQSMWKITSNLKWLNSFERSNGGRYNPSRMLAWKNFGELRLEMYWC